MNLPQLAIADFQFDGVTVLRGLFREWVTPLREGIREVVSPAVAEPG